MPIRPRASVRSIVSKGTSEMDNTTDIEILNENSDKDTQSEQSKSTTSHSNEENSLQKTGSSGQAEVIELDNSGSFSDNDQDTEYDSSNDSGHSELNSSMKDKSNETNENGVQEKQNTNSGTNNNSRKSTDSVETEKKDCSLVDNQVQCVNLHCQSGYDLAEAPVFALTYFGVTRRKNVLQKVCRECFDLALKHQQNMSLLLKNNVPLLTANFPTHKDDVVVMDPVEEIYEEEVLPSSVISLVEEQLMNIMKESVEQYNMDFQIRTSQEILTEKYEKLSVTNKEINNELNSIEKTLDQARSNIYKEFMPRYRNLPTLNILEAGEVPTFAVPSTRSITAKKTTQRITPPISLLTPTPALPPPPPPPPPPSPKDTNQSTESGDVVTLEEVEIQAKLPPVGTMFYPLLYAGCPVFAMKSTNFGAWSKARVIEVLCRPPEGPSSYRVRFEYSRAVTWKVLSGKQLAYNKPSPMRYPVGTRVIALFHNSDSPGKEAYYAGVIAEPPKILNIFRYLVFFDDGYAQYVSHEKILLVTESSRLVYEDIHPDSREFIKSYLERYPERPMVKLQKGQVVKTEWNGKWWTARVLAIDGSLAKMHFIADNRTEWIYRGSSRLGPLYSELAAAAARKEQGALSRHRSLGIASLKKRNMPYVEYSVDQDDAKSPQGAANVSKNVAKKSTGTKSTSQDCATEKHHGPPKLNEKMEHTSLGVIRVATLTNRLLGRPFFTHQCGTSCQDWTKFFKGDCKGYNPLTIPLYYGYERQIVKSKGNDPVIMYRAPCGRRLRNMFEVHRYLKITKSLMGVDYFDFDPALRVRDEFILEPHMYCTFVKDISYGRENTPVSCVNEINHSWPSFMDYSTSRIPQEGVNICNDEEFLVCCDCIDDCEDKQKCECWQLTLEGAKATSSGGVDLNVGYQYKRLLEPVTTGIYECNQRCKCSSTCFNRVAQHPLQLNLQVFRTLKKGWGLRTLNDIPQGGFICIYAGRLHTEQSANDDGRMYGDEYLAELDYIEVVERFKEGYESDVIDPSGEKQNEDGEGDGDEGAEQDEEVDECQMNSDDTDYVPQGLNRLPKTENVVNTRGRYKKLNSEEKSESEGEKEKEEDGDNDRESLVTDEDDDEMKKKPSKFTAAVPVGEELPPKYKSVREMFGDGADDCYVMDAKSSGNIGRYLNHSCQPNVFVQNVFVDTHDVRFPWVAFFALSHIKAGTELTWDYNYDIGSVPGKVMYCYCNNAECRGRLL